MSYITVFAIRTNSVKSPMSLAIGQAVIATTVAWAHVHSISSASIVVGELKTENAENADSPSKANIKNTRYLLFMV